MVARVSAGPRRREGVVSLATRRLGGGGARRWRMRRTALLERWLSAARGEFQTDRLPRLRSRLHAARRSEAVVASRARSTARGPAGLRGLAERERFRLALGRWRDRSGDRATGAARLASGRRSGCGNSVSNPSSRNAPAVIRRQRCGRDALPTALDCRPEKVKNSPSTDAAVRRGISRRRLDGRRCRWW